MSLMNQAAPRRNTFPTLGALGYLSGPLPTPANDDEATANLCPGARLIRKRTGWSVSLSNAVAAAWSYGLVREA